MTLLAEPTGVRGSCGTGCVFCAEFAGTYDGDGSFGQLCPDWPYPDRVIFSTDNWLLVPDAAPLAKLHALLVPRQHRDSILGAAITPEFEEVLQRALGLLRAAGFEPAFFEHGDCGSGGVGCVDHAHLHIIPESRGVVARLLSDFENTQRFSSIAHASTQHSGRSYLLASANRSQSVFYVELEEPDTVPQYFRRALAAAHRTADFCWRNGGDTAGALRTYHYLRAAPTEAIGGAKR